ncbi:MAG TPA: hypothetical protein DCY24_04120 [Rikenellaceae bacterium]|nr:hypothetical protein [Rikenellaceae bacterium]
MKKPGIWEIPGFIPFEGEDRNGPIKEVLFPMPIFIKNITNIVILSLTSNPFPKFCIAFVLRMCLRKSGTRMDAACLSKKKK